MVALNQKLRCVIYVGCSYNGGFHSLPSLLPCLQGVQRRQSRAGDQEDRGASPEVPQCRADEGRSEPHSTEHPEQAEEAGNGVCAAPPPQPQPTPFTVTQTRSTPATSTVIFVFDSLPSFCASVRSYGEELSRCQEEVRRLHSSLAAARDDCVGVSDERLQLQQENLRLRKEMDELRKATLLLQKKAKQQVCVVFLCCRSGCCDRRRFSSLVKLAVGQLLSFHEGVQFAR